MPTPLWFLFLEAVFGSLILWLGYRQLRVLQREWPVEKTDTMLPADDTPNLALRKALLFLCGVVLSAPMIGMLIAWRYRAGIDVFSWLAIAGAISLPSYNLLLAYYRERLERQSLSPSHPWSAFVLEIAQAAQVPLPRVYFRAESDRFPYSVDSDGLVLTSMTLRKTPPDVLAFYTCATLYDLKTGFVRKRRTVIGLLLLAYLLLFVTLKFVLSENHFTTFIAMSSMPSFLLGTYLEIFAWQPHLARDRFALQATNDPALAERSIRYRWEKWHGGWSGGAREEKFQKYLAKVGKGWVPKIAPTLPAPIVVAPEERTPVPLRRQ